MTIWDYLYELWYGDYFVFHQTDIIFTLLRSHMSSSVRFFEQTYVYFVNFE